VHVTLVQDRQVDEVTNAGVVAAAVVTLYGVQLLRGVPLDVDDLDGRSSDVRESE
jgi:hypothetical protein